MKQFMANTVTLTAIAALGLFTSSSLSQEPAKRVDPSGTWRFEVDSEEHSIELQLGQNGSLTGKHKGPVQEGVSSAIEGGKVEGDKVTVHMRVYIQGVLLKVKFEGQMKNDDITGVIVVTVPRNGRLIEEKSAWLAKRSVKGEDVVGTWGLKIDGIEPIRAPILEIRLDGKELKGNYTDPNYGTELAVQQLRIEENHLKFSIEGKFRDSDFKADFNGRPYGSKITGTTDYVLSGQPGKAKFEGVRKSEEEKQ